MNKEDLTEDLWEIFNPYPIKKKKQKRYENNRFI